MTKVKLSEGSKMCENEEHSSKIVNGGGFVKIESVTKNKYPTFNVMQSSEISKVLRELTQCVANERDFFIHDQRDHVNPGKQELMWEILPRSDISCSEVSGSTTTNFSLDLGADMVRSSQTHVCGDCGKHFSKRDFLQKHRIVHEEPRHRCVVCEKSFVREDKLKRHFVSIHSKHRPHVCSICAKAFARKDKLKDHQKHHLTAGDSFLCHECHISFVQKSDLNKHSRGFHSGPSSIKDTPMIVSSAVTSAPSNTTVLQVKPAAIKTNKARSRKPSRTSKLSGTSEMSDIVSNRAESLPQCLSSNCSMTQNNYTSVGHVPSLDPKLAYSQASSVSFSHQPLSTALSQYSSSMPISNRPLSTSLPQYSSSMSLSHNHLPTSLFKPLSSTSIIQNPSTSTLSQYPSSISLSQHPPSLSSFLQHSSLPLYHNYSYPLDHQNSLISTVFSIPSSDVSLQLRSPAISSHSRACMLTSQQHLAYSQQHQTSHNLLRYYPYLPQQRPPFIGHVDYSRHLTTNLYPYTPF